MMFSFTSGNRIDLADFLPFLPREPTSVSSCLIHCTLSPFWKGSKRIEFAPKGSKFFPFTVDPFQKGGKIILTELLPRKCIHSTGGGDDDLVFYVPFNII